MGAQSQRVDGNGPGADARAADAAILPGGDASRTSRDQPAGSRAVESYPLPNFTGSTRYNYQIPLIGGTHQDSLQARMNKQVKKNQYSGTLGLQSTRTDNTNLFGFLDTGRSLGMNLQLNWRHRSRREPSSTSGISSAGFRRTNIPFFANHENVVGPGGDHRQQSGPAELGSAGAFLRQRNPGSERFAVLGDSQPDRRRFGRWPVESRTPQYHLRSGFPPAQFNSLSQQDPRGTFTFTGQAAGSDFAGFLLGVPDTASIAFGNADKYFRSSSYDAFVQDDWRMRSSFTLNVGVRWEYSSPITELYGRLVNLDVAPGFTAVAPVLGSSPTGPLTRQSYPSSLVHPDKNNIAPQDRHLLASVLRVVHGGPRRLRRLLRHLGLPDHRDSDGAAISALEELAVQNSPDNAAHAGERFYRRSQHHREHLRGRS